MRISADLTPFPADFEHRQYKENLAYSFRGMIGPEFLICKSFSINWMWPLLAFCESEGDGVNLGIRPHWYKTLSMGVSFNYNFSSSSCKNQFKLWEHSTYRNTGFWQMPFLEKRIFLQNPHQKASEKQEMAADQLFRLSLMGGAIAGFGGMTLIFASLQQVVRNYIQDLVSGKVGEFSTSIEQPNISFDQVGGYAEAKTSLREMIQHVKDPKRFEQAGATTLKGVLLAGSPGVGKTLLAKAVAKEAGVNFLFVSGADLFGKPNTPAATCVKKLFGQARANAPCIVFIDEIDSVAQSRERPVSSAEQQQAMLQLLVEMDGFSSREHVVVMAATNRPESLDSAMLRPGRFDRVVPMTLPTLQEREEILRVFFVNIVHDHSVNLSEWAKAIPGYSGAQIRNWLNEAITTSLQNGRDTLTTEDLQTALIKLRMGGYFHAIQLSASERSRIAYHEAARIVIARALAGYDKVFAATIVPHGDQLSLTAFTPNESNIVDRSYLENQITVALASRGIEELRFGDEKAASAFSTRAARDQQMAAHIAREMVVDYGFSVTEKRSLLQCGAPVTSEQNKRLIDEEINKILKTSYSKALKLLTEHSQEVDLIQKALLQRELLTAADIDHILKKK